MGIFSMYIFLILNLQDICAIATNHKKR